MPPLGHYSTLDGANINPISRIVSPELTDTDARDSDTRIYCSQLQFSRNVKESSVTVNTETIFEVTSRIRRRKKGPYLRPINGMHCSPSYVSSLQDLLPFPFLQPIKPSIFFDPIVAELASWLAMLSVDSSLTVRSFLGGSLKLASLAQSGAVLFDTDSRMVFIPTGALGGYSLETKYIICAAIQACGGTSVVDAENVVGADRRSPKGRQLYASISSALNYLASLYMSCDNLHSYVMMILVGLLKVASVLPHSNEGGLFQEVLAKYDPGSPSGCMTSISRHVRIFPEFTTEEDASVRSFTASVVDSFLLTSMALVSIADPGRMHVNQWYPTILSSPDGEGHKLAAALALALPEFLVCYTPLLTRYAFGHDLGYVQMHVLIDELMKTAMTLGTSSSFCTGELVAPWYCIDPNGIIDLRYPEVTFRPAVSHSVLLMDSPDGQGGMVDAFQYPAKHLLSHGEFNLFAIDFVTLRNNPFFWFNLFVYGKNPNKGKGMINCVMQRIDADELFRTSDDTRKVSRFENRFTVVEYSWGSGPCALPAPSEVMYTGGRAVFLQKVEGREVSEDYFKVEDRQDQEMPIHCFVSSPRFIHSPSTLVSRAVKMKQCLGSKKITINVN